MRRLVAVGGLNLALVAACALVGLAAHSLAVLSEALDYLADAAAIGVSVVALRVADRRPRAPEVAAAVNAGWLLVLSLLVVAGALTRLAAGTKPVEGLPVLVVSGVAALTMLAGARLLEADDDDLNMRAVLLDTVADAAAAAGVAVTGGVILATGGWYRLDPAVALAVSVVVAYHAAKLLRRLALQARAARSG